MQRSSAVKSVVEFIVNKVVLDAESKAVSFMQVTLTPTLTLTLAKPFPLCRMVTNQKKPLSRRGCGIPSQRLPKIIDVWWGGPTVWQEKLSKKKDNKNY